MRYTHLELTDWYGLYGDGELLSEGHSLSVSELAAFKEGDSAFVLETHDCRDTDLDTEVSQRGGLAGLPLERCLELAA